MTVPERRISFTDDQGSELQAASGEIIKISILDDDNLTFVRLAPVQAEQLAHCLLAWAKEVRE